MFPDSSPPQGPPEHSLQDAGSRRFQKHKRTASLAVESIDWHVSQHRPTASFDFLQVHKGDSDQQTTYLHAAIDDRLLVQNDSIEKIQIIEPIDADLSLITGLNSNSQTFFPLQNRLSAAGWDSGHLLSSTKLYQGFVVEKDVFLKAGGPRNQLCSIPEQSELASSIFNSIHKHSNPEMQKMLSSHGFRVEDGEGDTSSHQSRRLPAPSITNPINSMAHLNVDANGDVSLVPADSKYHPSTSPCLPTEAFRKSEVPDRQQLCSDNFDSKKLPRTDMSKKPGNKTMKISRKFDSSSKKDTILKDDLAEIKKQRGSDRKNYNQRILFNPTDPTRLNTSQEKADKQLMQRKAALERNMESKKRMRRLLQEFRHEFGPPVLQSPQVELANNPKENSGIFSTLLKKDVRHTRIKADHLAQFIKTVKSDERPDVIQKLFKFRVEFGKVIKRDGKKDLVGTLKPKVKTLTYIPGEPEPKSRLAHPRLMGFSHRQIVRPPIHLDGQFKQSFLRRFERPERPTADHLSQSSCEHPLSGRKYPTQGPVVHKPRRNSITRPCGQYRIKTESDASRKRLIYAPDKHKPTKFLKQQNTDTKTRNLNIYFPARDLSMESSSQEEVSGAPKAAPGGIEAGKLVWNSNKMVATLLPKKQASRLFGKTRSLSSACLSRYGKNPLNNLAVGNSIHLLGDKGQLVLQDSPKADLRRTRMLGSIDRKTELLYKDLVCPPKIKQRADRPTRLISGEMSGVRKRTYEIEDFGAGR